jgi:bisphosphoglycerate-dependent phosphoglycerate mutase
MKKEQVYYEEHTPTKGEKCRLEIKLFRKSVLTIFQSFIDGQKNVVVLHGEGLRALKKILEGVK